MQRQLWHKIEIILELGHGITPRAWLSSLLSLDQQYRIYSWLIFVYSILKPRQLGCTAYSRANANIYCSCWSTLQLFLLTIVIDVGNNNLLSSSLHFCPIRNLFHGTNTTPVSSVSPNGTCLLWCYVFSVCGLFGSSPFSLHHFYLARWLWILFLSLRLFIVLPTLQ